MVKVLWYVNGKVQLLRARKLQEGHPNLGNYPIHE
jgi:hypothetical protein